MADPKLTQLATSEFKFDSPSSFCLNSNNNCIVFNNSFDVTIFELMYNCESILLMPYSIKQLKVSQEKPISEIIRQINLMEIYENATVLESQELACDIIYTADCAVEPIKAKILQAEVVTKNEVNICCLLTNYGFCDFYEKDGIIGDWKAMGLNFVNILFTEVFPLTIQATSIKTYKDLMDFTNKFIITAFTISQQNKEMIIYLGTAAGYVVALKYNDATCKFEPYCNLKTSLGRICYLTTCKHFILAACNQGRVLVLKVNFESKCMLELNYLWSITDRMTCQRALFDYNNEMNSYLVAFCKASHILVFRLDKEATIECSSTLYVSGIKITGIEPISSSEFIITTITGAVKHIKVSCPSKEELFCEEQSIDHDFDATNYQILGVAASASKYLWSFLLFRNKDYLYRPKFTAHTAFINVCKLSSQDSFDALKSWNLKNMNLAQDLVLSVSLNIFNNLDIDKYMTYLYLDKLDIPHEINDSFLHKLQVKLVVARNLSKYQLNKYKKLKDQTKTELQILAPALQLLHILGRMRYLKRICAKKVKLSKFQRESLRCMQLQFKQLLTDIASIANDDETTLELCNVPDKFTKYFRNQISKFNFDTESEFAEVCVICNSHIVNFKTCEQKHEIKRCTISYTQLSLFQTKYCPHCFSLARNDDEVDLQELYEAEESVTCIYCRFAFKQDKMKFDMD